VANNPKPGEPEDSIKNLIKQFGNLETLRASFDVTKTVDSDPNKIAALNQSKIQEEVTKKRLENEGIKQDHADQIANRDMRFKYSKWVFGYLVGYSIVVGVILVLAGFKIGKFELDSDVLKFLVGSTAASAIGLVAAVTTGLFHTQSLGYSP